MKISELKYSNTNTYLISLSEGYALFDTGWAGTFEAFCSSMGEIKASVQDIRYIFLSHFHPDHMGIAQNIAMHGARIVVTDIQKTYIHNADSILQRKKSDVFIPIDDATILEVSASGSRDFLQKIGISGEILHTPGHSDDSISLILDEGIAFVGDLNPLYELEAHKASQIYDSWQKILSHNPQKIYYGHAKTADLSQNDNKQTIESQDRYNLVKKIMKYTDAGKSIDIICRKTGEDKIFVEDVIRMYLTHRDVGVQGILDRIEIKNK